MKPVQEIFQLYASHLPERWRWCTIHFMYGEGRTRQFIDCGMSEDRAKIDDFDDVLSVLASQFQELRNMIAPPPMEQPTHVELTIHPDGKFDTVLGYGEPNWDPAPRGWPDDITAEDYTYTKAWPNGLPDETKEILEDPRSLIGYD